MRMKWTPALAIGLGIALAHPALAQQDGVAGRESVRRRGDEAQPALDRSDDRAQDRARQDGRLCVDRPA